MGRALVTGVSGSVGGVLAARLRGGGFEVRTLVRTGEQAERSRAAGWLPVYGDLENPSTLAEAVAGVDVVVHAAAYLGTDWTTAEAVNVRGTSALAVEARAAGVRRFVHISTMSAHGEPQPDGLSETSSLAVADETHAYVATKARAEVQIAGMRAPDFAVTVLRPGAICSSTNSSWGDRLVQRLHANGWPAARHPLDVIPWVHTEDLASMTLLCATTSAAADETFLAVDANVSLAEFWGPICEALEVPIHVPDRSPTISRCQIGKIRGALGYEPRHGFDDTVVELVDYAWRVRGQLDVGTRP